MGVSAPVSCRDTVQRSPFLFLYFLLLSFSSFSSNEEFRIHRPLSAGALMILRGRLFGLPRLSPLFELPVLFCPMKSSFNRTRAEGVQHGMCPFLCIASLFLSLSFLLSPPPPPPPTPPPPPPPPPFFLPWNPPCSLRRTGLFPPPLVPSFLSLFLDPLFTFCSSIGRPSL